MIKIKVLKEDIYYRKIRITGHANYDDYGKDIVCSAVSSIVITTINAINKVTLKTIKYDDKNGIIIEVLKDDDITNKLLDNMLDMLSELSTEYEGTIKFL